jgi:DDE domain
MEAAEQWEPDDARVSRPVLRERGLRLSSATRLFVRIRGVLHYLWRAVDQDGVVLDVLVQNRRNAAAAKRFFKRLLRRMQYKPRRLITDGLRGIVTLAANGRHCHRSDRTQSIIHRFGYTSPVAKSERRSRGSAGNRMLPSGDAVGGNDHRRYCAPIGTAVPGRVI